MKIIVNGEPQTLAATTLAQALEEFGYDAAVVATALNGRFVSTASRATTALADGDALEIVAPMQGG